MPILSMSRLVSILARVILTLIFGIVTFGVVSLLFPQQALTVDSGYTKADEMVVLGGGDGRAERAAELYQQGAAPGILVTGYGDCEINIALLEKGGVPTAVITAEPRALTTEQNAMFSVPILRKMGAQRVIIVTSWYHSRRAVACFEHFAPDIEFYSRPSYLDYRPDNINRARYNQHVNLEYLKLLDYWVSYGVCPL
jgi:uncharacterized SAM-binding protein YcdF (DUF218 family)